MIAFTVWQFGQFVRRRGGLGTESIHAMMVRQTHRRLYPEMHSECGALTFLETKNGRPRRIPLSAAAIAVLGALPRQHAYVFTNVVTLDRYIVNGAAHVFKRAVRRAGITTDDVTLRTLRHMALSRMVTAGIDDYTVMAVSGHSSTRMLERYTHPTEARKIDALDSFNVARAVTTASQSTNEPVDEMRELRDLLKESGGRQEARTPDLRVANAALSQLS
jgi:integrase